MKTKFLLVSKHKNIHRLFSTAAGAANNAVALAIDYGYQNGISAELNKTAAEIEEQLALGFDVMIGFEYYDRDNEIMPIDYDYPVMIRPVEHVEQAVAL